MLPQLCFPQQELLLDKLLPFGGDWSFLRTSCCKYLHYVLSRQSVGCWGVFGNEAFCLISMYVLQARIFWMWTRTSSCISYSLQRMDLKIWALCCFSLCVLFYDRWGLKLFLGRCYVINLTVWFWECKYNYTSRNSIKREQELLGVSALFSNWS